MTPDLTTEALRVSNNLDDCLDFLKRQIREAADAELAYREAKAKAWVTTEGTAKEREAIVDGVTAGLRKQRDLADGMKQAAMEAIRSRRSQIGLFMTLLAAERSEMELAR